ncbi:LCP family glycopolymer transferase [Paenibacillus cisolokensis]|jgi:cell envelope-related function transcriptional attenuator common domain|nr:LCP family protein [Paenibacillus cisolokensis]
MRRPLAKRIMLISGIALLLILTASAGYGWYLYRSVEQTVVRMYEPIESDEPDAGIGNPEGRKRPERLPLAQRDKEQQPFTVLIMGIDERPGDPGRSDTLIVISVNPDKEEALLFNIPRDTRTEIVGRGVADKINHAHAFGGVKMTVETVERFLDYPIDYYMKVNMEGFVALIDLLGGVEVNNTFAFDNSGYHFDKGVIQLQGEEALSFSRMRYEDPRGDLGRNERQRAVIRAIMDKTLTFSNVTQVNKVLDQVAGYVKTNMTFDEMKTFLFHYRPRIKTISSTEIKGSGTRIGGIYYYQVDGAERDRIHKLLAEHQTGGDG